MGNWALTQIEQGKWAIKPEGLSLLLSVATRGEAGFEGYIRSGEGGYEGKDALLARDGVKGKSAGTSLHTVDNKRIAYMEIAGPIFRRANMMTEHSGATALASIAKSFAAADLDPAVSAHVIEFDSPGGEVTGTREFANMLATATKPVVAYAGGNCCSAAYWIASASKAIVADPTADLGSIGVIMTMPDTKAEDGTYRYVSSNAPHKVPDPSDKADSARLQREVDETGKVFSGEVAAYRGISQEKVEKEFGQGGTLMGQAAVDAGMADQVGTLRDAFALAASLAESKGAAKPKQGKAIMENETQITAEQFQELQAQIESLKTANATLAGQAKAAEEKAAKEKAAAIVASAKAFTDKQIKAGSLLPADQALVEQTYIALSALDTAGDTITVGDEQVTFAGAIEKIFAAKASANVFGGLTADANLMGSFALQGSGGGNAPTDEEFAAAQVAKYNAARGHKEKK